MTDARRPAIWMLGAVQCVYWGILYYAYSVLAVPMRSELGATTAGIAGAFSLGLGVSAALAARVGRRLDRGEGSRLLLGGASAAAGLLLAWSAITTTIQLYLVWTGLGACMSVVLYETAFALVTREIADPARRLRALAAVTVMGGLASTLFLPLAGICSAAWGWRATLHLLAVLWVLATLLLWRRVLPTFTDGASPAGTGAAAPRAKDIGRRAIVVLGAPFVVATFAAMALTIVVIPRLVEQGHSLQAASVVLAALGVMQLPGRVWLWLGGHAELSARQLLIAPLLLQAVGLLLVALSDGLVGAFGGVALFGIGAGLQTLARPWIVPLRFGVAVAGRVNGDIARAQGVARAAGPFAAAAAAETWGSSFVFVALTLSLLVCVPVAWWACGARPSSAPRAG
ncbi:MAG TPA: MFS transporter [Tahibacter sp.]|uniref:MFS transporter n=1 Tax=Tahibacter sp. TaxID=2056211 RepID=UPI002BF4D16D|nr:MFS transporter [Tahibacter sp.]HSX62594.1 MFS transporter [Tahibacter sp.]